MKSCAAWLTACDVVPTAFSPAAWPLHNLYFINHYWKIGQQEALGSNFGGYFLCQLRWDLQATGDDVKRELEPLWDVFMYRISPPDTFLLIPNVIF